MMKNAEYLRHECSFVEFEKLCEWVEKMTALEQAVEEDHRLEMERSRGGK